jgi:hypothetical protein
VWLAKNLCYANRAAASKNGEAGRAITSRLQYIREVRQNEWFNGMAATESEDLERAQKIVKALCEMEELLLREEKLLKREGRHRFCSSTHWLR